LGLDRIRKRVATRFQHTTQALGKRQAVIAGSDLRRGGLDQRSIQEMPKNASGSAYKR
jgi:hypothetical protein